MPLRIAIAGAIAIAACVVVPVSVNAVSSAEDGQAAGVEDAEPPEPEPRPSPAAAITADGFAGASIHSAGYGVTRSWTILLMLIAAGFVPAVILIARSTARRRAGPEDDVSTA